jgi:chemotaxis protein methyltransferase CheR
MVCGSWAEDAMSQDTAYRNERLSGSYTLSDKEYRQLSDIIYESAGISLGNNKKELVHARLSKLMRKRGISGFSEYLAILAADKTGNELVGLMDAISTNVTHFFREHQHFDFLVEAIQKNLLYSNLKIWSAGCSSGEEPYSIAITLLEHIVNQCRTKPQILATDLSTKVLDRAISGVFPAKSIESVDPAIVRKYFLKGRNDAENLVKVKPEVKSMVSFQRLNFMEQFSFQSTFDFIFCRNVMIYFDNSTRERLIARFYDSLKSGGYLIIGHSESLSGLSHTFQYVKPTIYRKP